jgi:23S rRNA (uracil1939-C5)-methyltransferase
MADRIAEAVGSSGHVADLYAGLGTFGFRLLPERRVTAVEGNAAMTAAMSEAAGRAGLAGRFSAQERDLAHAPMTAAELDRFGAVIFDPPRQGAREQSQHLAASSVPLVVAASCNPVSFGRDARILVDGGYRLDTIWPIDQFLWSHHLELVAVFRRG